MKACWSEVERVPVAAVGIVDAIASIPSDYKDQRR